MNLLVRMPIAALILLLVSPLPAASVETVDATLQNALAWQIALDSAGYSSGIIDGKVGRKAEHAAREFQAANGLAPTGKLDDATAAALGVNPAAAVGVYTVADEDLAAVGGPLPKKWQDKSKLRHMAYAALGEALAERFHCTQALLVRLNPGKNINRLSAGECINVPAVRPSCPSRAAASIEVNLVAKTVRAVGRDGQTLALFHCSIAKKKENLPAHDTSVAVISRDPVYVFDPAKWPEVKGVNRKLCIPPGPRNPVGKCWIGLGLKGYGIHGSPSPEMIGKTGSHGCIRLTNWDALRLATMIRVGIPVHFVR